jgi:hypothetical protein
MLAVLPGRGSPPAEDLVDRRELPGETDGLAYAGGRGQPGAARGEGRRGVTAEDLERIEVANIASRIAGRE